MKKEYKAPSMTIMTVEPIVMQSGSAQGTLEIKIKDEFAAPDEEVL